MSQCRLFKERVSFRFSTSWWWWRERWNRVQPRKTCYFSLKVKPLSTLPAHLNDFKYFVTSQRSMLTEVERYRRRSCEVWSCTWSRTQTRTKFEELLNKSTATTRARSTTKVQKHYWRTFFVFFSNPNSIWNCVLFFCFQNLSKLWPTSKTDHAKSPTHFDVYIFIKVP